jgi:hypothetical protein
MIKLGSLFNSQTKEAATFLKANRNVSNKKAKTILEWTPIASQEQTIFASVESMVRYGLIK